MHSVPDRTGRFAERPHYEPAELDRAFERIAIEFLRTHRGRIEFPISTDDLTVLIERDTEDLDPYANLLDYGPDVEGVTEFRPDRKPRVRIAEVLATTESRENRYRTTLTHEYGHVHLHGYLFAMKASARGGLFAGKPKSEIVACKRDTIVSARQADWMEWQAGYACGALLMPASHAKAVVDDYRRTANLFGPVPAATEHGQAIISRVSERFQVSRDAARVRLSALGVLGTAPAERSLFG